MTIPEPFNSIIKKNYATCGKNPKEFFSCCFTDLIKQLHITDYQARASQTGKMFEHAFWYLMKQHGIELERDYVIKRACMDRGGSLDFGILEGDKVVCGIEAKGSDESASSRPALKRTDTVKKAIAQAYQFKRTFDKSVPFFVVTNVMPTEGNAKCMLDLAEGDIIDKIVDLTDEKQLNDFVSRLKKLSS